MRMEISDTEECRSSGDFSSLVPIHTEFSDIASERKECVGWEACKVEELTSFPNIRFCLRFGTRKRERESSEIALLRDTMYLEVEVKFNPFSSNLSNVFITMFEKNQNTIQVSNDVSSRCCTILSFHDMAVCSQHRKYLNSLCSRT